MGLSNRVVLPFYERRISKSGKVGYLGDRDKPDGDCYDLSLGNWNINDKWALRDKYDTLICTRTAPFASSPLDFLERCHTSLNEGGVLYVDWLYGEHWRFPMFKVGWLRNDEQEHAYEYANYLWSGVWDDSFMDHPAVEEFDYAIKKSGYYSSSETLPSIMKNEVPSLLGLGAMREFFEIEYSFLYCDAVAPSLYVLLTCKKIDRDG